MSKLLEFFVFVQKIYVEGMFLSLSNEVSIMIILKLDKGFLEYENYR